jgi:hypothetical protein
MAPTDIFTIWCSVNVDGGCDVVRCDCRFCCIFCLFFFFRLGWHYPWWFQNLVQCSYMHLHIHVNFFLFLQSSKKCFFNYFFDLFPDIFQVILSQGLDRYFLEGFPLFMLMHWSLLWMFLSLFSNGRCCFLCVTFTMPSFSVFLLLFFLILF